MESIYRVSRPPSLEVIEFLPQLGFIRNQRLKLALHLRFLLGYGGKLDLQVLDGVFVGLSTAFH